MKAIFKIALAASVVATASAEPHVHGHRHGRRQFPSRVEKRVPDQVVKWVSSMETVYQLMGGGVVPHDQAVDGIKNGMYVVVGESTPSLSTPAAPEATKSVSAGNFIEKQSTQTTYSTTAASSTSSAAASSSTQGSSSSSTSGSSTGSGLNSEFPSGQLDCDFPSNYGPIPADWLGLDNWTGVQKVPNYTPGDSSISYIVNGVNEGCSKNSFCSYACPPGYQKSQWPEAQGATGQSIGGLYCNSQGKLELSRPSVKTLCTPGEGGVVIKNSLSQSVAVCRTDYPGFEAMTIPLETTPGGTFTLTNPDEDAYKWNNMLTSAQYYVNQPGVSVPDACVWNSPTNPKDGGNWAPLNLGVGKTNGITWIGMFPNAPTSTATLKFNIRITGGSNECKMENGVYSGGSNGCTVSVPEGSTATIEFYD